MKDTQDATPTVIEKCAAIIVRDRRLLVVRKRGTDILISPGGKIDPGETRIECLRRELDEELGVTLAQAEFFGSFRNPSAFEKAEVSIHTYLCEVTGDLTAQAEIEEFRWVGGKSTNPELQIGSVFADFVIPRLVDVGLIDA